MTLPRHFNSERMRATIAIFDIFRFIILISCGIFIGSLIIYYCIEVLEIRERKNFRLCFIFKAVVDNVRDIDLFPCTYAWCSLPSKAALVLFSDQCSKVPFSIYVAFAIQICEYDYFF